MRKIGLKLENYVLELNNFWCLTDTKITSVRLINFVGSSYPLACMY